VVVEDVEAPEAVEGDAVVDLGVGLPAEHLDVVPHVHEGLAEVADVDALAAAVRLASVRQERDAQGFVVPGDSTTGRGGGSTTEVRHGGKSARVAA